MTLPQVGQVFGRYRIDDTIGRGGMGVVLGATDTGLGRRVALKVVATELGGTDEFRMRFEREAATLAKLDSPHVIAIYDYGTQDDCPYIATQYVAGGDLGTFLHRRGPMRAVDALTVCGQVADALDDAHRAGIVHRDVKPTNVLVRDPEADELHVYLCDFGIARTGTDGLTAAGAVAGTWSYLAPENGRGVPATASSDIYAVGCLLWAALTGHPPYRGTDVEIALAHQRDPVPQLVSDSPLVRAVDEIIARSMAKDAADRYPDAGALRAALVAASTLPGAGEVLPADVRDPTVPPHTWVRPGTPAGAHAQPSSPSHPPSRPPSAPPSYPSHPSHPSTPGYQSASYPPQPSPTWSGSEPPARRGKGRLVVAAVAALVLVGGGAAAVVVGTGADEPSGGTSAGPTTGGSSGTDASQGGDGAPADTGPISGDLDGDGLGDLSIDYDPADGDTLLSTTWSSDGSTFVEAETADLGPRSGEQRWRVMGHLDDDAVTDVLTFSRPERDGPVTVTSELSGGGTVDAELPGSADLQSQNDALADLDGDGIDELLHLEVVGASEGLVLTTRTLDGSTASEPVERLRLDQDLSYVWIRHGDFDGDGSADIATVDLEGEFDDGLDGVVEVRLGDGEGFAEPISAPFTSTGGQVFLRSGDIDADGDDEVVVADLTTQLVVLNLFDLEDGTIIPRGNAGSLRLLNTVPLDLAVTDVDGDARDDVVSLAQTRQGGPARALVAVSGGATFTSSRWLEWDQTFTARTNGDNDLFDLLEDARW